MGEKPMRYMRGLGQAVAEAIERLGNHLGPFATEIAARLAHSSPFMRLLALGALVAAKQVSSFEEAVVNLLRKDVDRGVRGAAAMALRGKFPWRHRRPYSFSDVKSAPSLLPYELD